MFQAIQVAATVALNGPQRVVDEAVEVYRKRQRAPVACIHPGWQPLHGRDSVLASWRDIMSSPTSPPIRCSDPVAHMLGAAAVVICTERFPGAELVATNVFVEEDGAWKLVHHQAGGVARPSGDDEGETLH